MSALVSTWSQRGFASGHIWPFSGQHESRCGLVLPGFGSQIPAAMQRMAVPRGGDGRDRDAMGVCEEGPTFAVAERLQRARRLRLLSSAGTPLPSKRSKGG